MSRRAWWCWCGCSSRRLVCPAVSLWAPFFVAGSCCPRCLSCWCVVGAGLPPLSVACPSSLGSPPLRGQVLGAVCSCSPGGAAFRSHGRRGPVWGCSTCNASLSLWRFVWGAPAPRCACREPACPALQLAPRRLRAADRRPMHCNTKAKAKAKAALPWETPAARTFGSLVLRSEDNLGWAPEPGASG